jgi:tetratricopeptide (TPR) repeat protein
MTRFSWLFAATLAMAAGQLMVATGQFHFGAAAMERSDAPTAIRYLTKATALTPTDRRPWQYLGRAYEFQEDWDRAIEAYNRAIALAPWHAITCLNVGRAERSRFLANRLLHFPSRARAIDALLRSVAANAYALEPRLWGGDLAVRASRFDDAQKFYGSVPADLVPTVPWHRAREAWLSALGNAAAARVERSNGDRLEVRELADAAEAAVAGGRPADAIKYAIDATTRFPHEVRGWEELGYLRHAQGDLAGARTAYQHMAALAPTSLTAQLDLAVIALNSHDLAGAERFSGRALALDPESLDAHVMLARLRAAQGRRAEAITEYEWVLSRAPSHPQAQEELRRLKGG